MKQKNNFPRAFIDLAQIGRTNWQSVALTFLLVKFLTILFSLSSVIAVHSSIFSEHGLFNISEADRTIVFKVVEAVACIFGLWLACKKIQQRPFRSLISIDMTFDIRRCLLGATLYLTANAVSFMAISLFSSMRAGAWVFPFRHVEWPHQNEQIVASMGELIIIPFLAFSEELFFRAWLTQTLGRYIRSTITVVVLVAVLFAVAHSQYDLRVKTLVMLSSLGFSALSLRDQRLELAIGAHAMLNVCATLQLLFFTGPSPHVQIPATTLDWCTLAVLKGILPFALIYGVLQKTRGWFVPANARLESPGNIQPRHL